ncbi:MAG: FAD-binding oxidoreductase, partial [Hyphomicrobiaceae bacterium]
MATESRRADFVIARKIEPMPVADKRIDMAFLPRNHACSAADGVMVFESDRRSVDGLARVDAARMPSAPPFGSENNHAIARNMNVVVAAAPHTPISSLETTCMGRPADLAPLAPPTTELIDRLTAIVGPAHAITAPNDQAPFLREWRDRYVGRTPLVLRPGSTQEVAEILALCDAARVGVVPQAGNTGLVGGQIPFEDGRDIVLSVSRLDRIRAVDPAGQTLVAEAGVTLANIQKAADDIGRLFPLSLAAEGSCQIGGNLATNAGGVGVLAYGNARNLVLGLEVVLADGR